MDVANDPFEYDGQGNVVHENDLNAEEEEQENDSLVWWQFPSIDHLLFDNVPVGANQARCNHVGLQKNWRTHSKAILSGTMNAAN